MNAAPAASLGRRLSPLPCGPASALGLIPAPTQAPSGTRHAPALALGLGLAWAATVVLLAGAHRPPARRPPPRRPTAPRRDARRAAGEGAPPRPLVPDQVGATLRRLAGRPIDRAADRRAGWAALAAVALLLVAPPLAPLPVAAAAVMPRLAQRRAGRAHEAAVVDQLPDVVDLLALTTSAGLPVTAAFAAIGSRPGGALGEGLAAGAAHAARGGTTAEALALLARVAGPAARPLIDALAEHDRYGTPLRPALERVGIEARLRRRRQAEEAARRLPVTLLFPLVLTTLPAFVILTVVPLLAGSFGSLSP
ncbi:MAG TPA: type II secretion system F family protein [Acidimicrobiales bacterium]